MMAYFIKISNFNCLAANNSQPHLNRGGTNFGGKIKLKHVRWVVKRE